MNVSGACHVAPRLNYSGQFEGLYSSSSSSALLPALTTMTTLVLMSVIVPPPPRQQVEQLQQLNDQQWQQQQGPAAEQLWQQKQKQLVLHRRSTTVTSRPPTYYYAAAPDTYASASTLDDTGLPSSFAASHSFNTSSRCSTCSRASSHTAAPTPTPTYNGTAEAARIAAPTAPTAAGVDKAMKKVMRQVDQNFPPCGCRLNTGSSASRFFVNSSSIEQESGPTPDSARHCFTLAVRGPNVPQGACFSEPAATLSSVSFFVAGNLFRDKLRSVQLQPGATASSPAPTMTTRPPQTLGWAAGNTFLTVPNLSWTAAAVRGARICLVLDRSVTLAQFCANPGANGAPEAGGSAASCWVGLHNRNTCSPPQPAGAPPRPGMPSPAAAAAMSGDYDYQAADYYYPVDERSAAGQPTTAAAAAAAAAVDNYSCCPRFTVNI